MPQLTLSTFICCFLFCPGIFGQSPEIKWKKVYDTDKREEVFYEALQGPDGNIAVVGEVDGVNTRLGKQAFLSIIDSNGEMLFQENYGKSLDDTANCIEQGPSNSYFIGGGQGKQAWLLRTDLVGALVWEKKLPFVGEPSPVIDLIYEPKVGIVYWVCENGELGAIQSDGKILWGKKVDQKGLRLRKIISSPDGNMFLLGELQEGSKSMAWLQKIDPAGTSQWDKPRMYPDIIAQDIIFDHNTTQLILAGTNLAVPRGDMALIRLNVRGNIIVKKNYGGSKEDKGIALIQTRNNHIFLLGIGRPSSLRGAKIMRIWLNHLDEKEFTVWDKNAYFGGDRWNLGSDIIELNNGDILAIGALDSGRTKKDGWLLCLKGAVQDRATVNNEQPFLEAPAVTLKLKSIHIVQEKKERLKRGEPYIGHLLIKNEGRMSSPIASITITPPPGVVVHTGLKQKLPVINAGKFTSKELQFSINSDYAADTIRFQFRVEDGSNLISFQNQINLEVEPLLLPTSSPMVNLQWASHRSDSISLLQNEVSIHLLATPVSPGLTLKDEDFTVWVNGDTLQSQKQGRKYKKVRLRRRNARHQAEAYDFEVDIPLAFGWNKVWVTSHKNGRQDISPPRYFRAGEKPNLFVLAIGVPFEDLKYTTKDAQEFANVLSLQQDGVYNRVDTVVLDTKKETELKSIANAIADLKRRSDRQEIRESDVLVLYISSHGQTLNGNKDELDFRIFASDTNEENVWTYSIDFQNLIMETLDKIPCKKLVFIDACRTQEQPASYLASSGARSGIKKPQKEAIYELINAEVNSQFLLSCSPGESSFEDKTWENGAFTKALLEALPGKQLMSDGIIKADANEDGYLSMYELSKFVQRRVPQLVRSAKKNAPQNPVLRPLNNGNSNLAIFRADFKK